MRRRGGGSAILYASLAFVFVRTLPAELEKKRRFATPFFDTSPSAHLSKHARMNADDGENNLDDIIARLAEDRSDEAAEDDEADDRVASRVGRLGGAASTADRADAASGGGGGGDDDGDGDGDGEGGGNGEEGEEEEEEEDHGGQVVPVDASVSLPDAIAAMEREPTELTSLRQLMSLVNTWTYVWCHYTTRSLEDTQRRQRLLFRADSPADYEQVMKLFEDYKARLSKLISLVAAKMHASEEREQYADVGDKFNQIMHNMQSMYDSLLLAILTMNPSTSLPPGCDLETIRFHSVDMSEFTPTTLLLYVYLRRIKLHGYGRMGDRVMRRVMSPEGGYDTHAWVDTGLDIDGLVYTMGSTGHFNGSVFAALFGVRGADRELIRQLKVVKTNDFPDIQPDRHIASFINGMYFRGSNQFFEYASREYRSFGNDVVSSKYFPIRFDNATYERIMKEAADDEKREDRVDQDDEMEAEDAATILRRTQKRSAQTLPKQVSDAFMKIPTPLVDKIMHDQGWSYETMRMFYMMMGRMLYELKEKDNWQVAPFFYGRGGTGKSLLMELIKHMYEVNRVGVLNNQVESFYLEGLLDKYILIASDIKSDFGMSQADFNMQVAGEMMNYARKNKTPVMKEFNLPALYCCNIPPRYANHGNSFVRRVILFYFGNEIKNANMKMLSDIKAGEFAAFTKKINCAYKWGIDTFKESGLMTKYLPEEMKQWRNFVVTHSNSLAKFIDSECELGARKFVPYHMFEKRAHQWCKEKNERINWDKSATDDIWSTFGIKLKDNEEYKEQNNVIKRGRIMVGVTLKGNEMHLPDSASNLVADPAPAAPAPAAPAARGIAIQEPNVPGPGAVIANPASV